MQTEEYVPLALEAHEIHKSFPNGSDRVDVLKGVTFQLRKGETVTIQGTSGSGKTTFLNIISGLEALDSGELFWHGNRIDGLSTSRLAALRAEQIGMVFQAYYLLPEINVLDNVILAARLTGKPGQEDRDRARELLVRVGLEERLSYSVEKLSGGERQRVAIARALLNHPHLVLADEPTGNLDEETGDSVIELLLDIAREEGTSLILVTHNAVHARKTDKRYRLHFGKLETIEDES